jgi:carbonic anhydrase
MPGPPLAGSPSSRPAARTAVATAALLLVAACGGTGSTTTAGDTTTAGAPATADTPGTERPGALPEVPWSYEGESGPANWAALEPGYATCAAGQRQSPVDLPAPAEAGPAAATDVTYDHRPAAFEVRDTGRTIRAEAASPAGGITVDGEAHELVQFHAHTPSEHAVAGGRTALEVHLVHRDAAGELVVIGVRVEEGGSTSAPAGAASALAGAWADLPTREETVALADFDAGALLPEDRTAYRYEGSLTTPPCTEGVQWLVLREPVTAPAAVIAGFAEAVGESARPLQPLGGRTPVLEQPTG